MNKYNFIRGERGNGKAYFDGIMSERKRWKNKIKAKIEEYREQIEELKDLNIFTYTEYEGAKEVLQSLLEKE